MDTMVITVPNVLTLLRILAVPFFAITVWYRRRWRRPASCSWRRASRMPWTATWPGASTRSSALGAILDPAADKLLITTALIMLAFPREGLVVRIPPWVTILAISRDVVIALVALLAYDHLHPDKFKPSILGKLTTFVELMAISLSLLVNTIGPYPWYRFLVPWIYYLMAVMVAGLRHPLFLPHHQPGAGAALSERRACRPGWIGVPWSILAPALAVLAALWFLRTALAPFFIAIVAGLPAGAPGRPAFPGACPGAGRPCCAILVFILVLGLLVWVLVPPFVAQVERLNDSLPALREKAIARWTALVPGPPRVLAKAAPGPGGGGPHGVPARPADSPVRA